MDNKVVCGVKLCKVFISNIVIHLCLQNHVSVNHGNISKEVVIILQPHFYKKQEFGSAQSFLILTLTM